MPSIVDKTSVKMVCVDDFALRKRFSYGTVMINLENHRFVYMIPSRDTNVVCNWLKTFHNIEVISRNGAITYASAATNSHPDVIQISDRFHLIKGLSEVICKYIFREFPARVEIPLTEGVTDEMKALYNTANRSLRIKFAHEKRREGLTISDIALLLHSSPKTIQKYLAIPEDQIHTSHFPGIYQQNDLFSLHMYILESGNHDSGVAETNIPDTETTFDWLDYH